MVISTFLIFCNEFGIWCRDTSSWGSILCIMVKIYVYIYRDMMYPSSAINSDAADATLNSRNNSTQILKIRP